MSGYSLGLTLENIRTITVMFLDIFLMWIVLYYAIRIVRGNNRTIQIFKGILLILIVDAVAKVLGLTTVAYLAEIFVNWGFLAIIIIFQPEIRQLLERIGKTNVFSRISTLTGNEKEHLVDQIVTATMLLSQDQTGALISLEQSHSLEDFIATGTRLNSDVTAELLVSIFVTSTPLHDGAVIIQGDKISCASAYFPPTNLDLPSRYGARHRAAIGISEITDAVTIVVSEETGGISITEGGKIFPVNRKELRDYLMRVILGEETEMKAPKSIPLENEKAVVVDDNNERQSLRSKLAVRKQEKIVTEEVVPAVHPETDRDIPVVEPMREEEMEKLAAEAEIKLPKKKERPSPSYPTHQVNRFEKSEPVRMTAEDVAKARAAFRDQYTATSAKPKSTKPVQTTVTAKPVEKVSENTADLIIDHKQLEETSKMYDTTKLDISKLVGLNEDLDQAFEALDQMDHEHKGGDGHGGR